MTWKAGNESTTRGYKFTYDGLSRLTSAIYGEGTDISSNANRFTEKVMGYDLNGNIKGLQRYGQTSSSAYGLIDDLTYTLSGNKLTRVDDAVNTSAYNNGFEFKDAVKQANEYAYDKNGNLTKDLNKNITSIQYNCLNLPSKVTFGNGNTITYLYAADGTKLRTVHKAGSTTTTTDYCGNVVYENGTQKLLLTEEGYVTLADTKYHYYLKDHQGNNRVVISQSGTVEETNHYYPFGGVFAATNNVQPYKYNGKEFDNKNGLNWYDYGARHYDAALGRFVSVDPLSEQDYAVSPYTYCGNNPVLRIDKDGRIWETVWDVGNMLYDAGAAVAAHIRGDHVSAQSHWVDLGVDAIAAALPFVPAGTTKALKAADKGVDAVQNAKTVDNVSFSVSSVLKNRVKLRNETKQAVRNAAPKTKDGKFIDPNTLQPIEKGQEVFGHKYGHEWYQYKRNPANQNKTRKDVIKDQNDPNIYQIEDKKSNASHKFEKKWK